MFVDSNFFDQIFKNISNSNLTDKLNADMLMLKCYCGKFDEVNLWLEDDKKMNPGKPGTEFKIFGIGKDGDYDFSLTPLTIIAYEYAEYLSNKAKENLVQKLLNQRGNKLLSEYWLCNLIPESENHLLSTNIAIHLTNQILIKQNYKEEFDNDKNGVNKWLKNYLTNIIINNFFEYNSKPYFSWTVRALQNLYSYTENQEIKSITKNILDRLFFKYSVQSKNGYLILPYRRRKDHLVDLIRRNDEFATWFLALSGDDKKFIPDEEFDIIETINHDMMFILTTIIQNYRPNKKLIDIALGDDKFFTKYRFSNIEITYKEKNFALFAGGTEDNFLPLIPNDNDATPRETCLFLNDKSTKVSQLIRFQNPIGFWRNKNNSGVYENFACGANIFIPESFNIVSKIKVNNIIYRFIETEFCYIVAGHINNDFNITGTLFNVGFLEIVNKSDFSNFNEFFTKVLNNNNNNFLYFDKVCKYKTTRNKEIYFRCLENSKNWLIKSVYHNDEMIDGDSQLNYNQLIVLNKYNAKITCRYFCD